MKLTSISSILRIGTITVLTTLTLSTASARGPQAASVTGTPEAADSGAKAQVSNLGTLRSYDKGVLKILVDTCGGTIAPVVNFTPYEEIAEEGSYMGLYKATISLSGRRSASQVCPYTAPSLVELDLTKLLKTWAFSPVGSRKARVIFEKRGMIEIAIPTLALSVNHQGLAQ